MKFLDLPVQCNSYHLAKEKTLRVNAMRRNLLQFVEVTVTIISRRVMLGVKMPLRLMEKPFIQIVNAFLKVRFDTFYHNNFNIFANLDFNFQTSASDSFCESENCRRNLYIFIGVFALTVFIHSTSEVGGMLIIMRCTHPKVTFYIN